MINFKGFLREGMKKAFLGGTCNESTWREIVKPQLNIDYFDPVVKDWTKECMEEEIKQRKICDYCLYVITPKMKGVYSIAEVADDSNKRPDKIIFCFIEKDDTESFDLSQIKSLTQVGKMVKNNGGKFFTSLDAVVKYLNQKEK